MTREGAGHPLPPAHARTRRVLQILSCTVPPLFALVAQEAPIVPYLALCEHEQPRPHGRGRLRFSCA